MVQVNKILTGIVGGAGLALAADSCNPLKSSGCSADAALAGSFSEDFTSEPAHFKKTEYATGIIDYSDSGMNMTIAKRYDNPSLKSDFYIMYGKVEVELKAAPGQGIVSSFYLQSDDLDEIDLEWVGGDTTQFQTNYFSKGNTATYDRGAFHSAASPQETFHNYTIDWAMDKTVFYLDGVAVRTLTNDSSQGYPESPMYVMMGSWAGGDSDNAPGTIEWAGGLTDYTQAPFSMFIKRVIVSDYSSGEEYSYNGQSGSWESIEAKNGEVYGRYDQAQSEFAALAGGESISSSATVHSSSTSSASRSASSTASSTSNSSSTVSSTSSTSSSASTTLSSSSKAGYNSTSSATPSSTFSLSSVSSKASTSSSAASTKASASSSASSSAASSKASASASASSTAAAASSKVSAATTTSASSTLATSTAEAASSSTSEYLAIATTNGAFALQSKLSSFLAALVFLI
ncbi:Glycosidase [Lachancea thermotolerans]